MTKKRNLCKEYLTMSVFLKRMVAISASMIVSTYSFPSYSQNDPYRTALLGVHPETLDPVEPIEYTGITLLGQICGRLLSLDSTLGLEGDIAETWRQVEPDRVFEFVIRPDIVFADGSELSNTDIVYSINRLSDPDSFISGWLEEIESVSAIAEDRVLISLRYPNPRFLSKLAYPRFCIVQEDKPVLSIGGTTIPNSPGAYKISSYADNSLTLTVSDRFRDIAREPEISVSYLSQSDAINAFNAGELHDLSFYFLTEDELSHIQNAKKLVQPIYWTWAMNLNPNSTLFSNKRNRHAFIKHFNLKKFREIWGANGEFSPSLIPAGLPGHVQNFAPSTFEPYEGATALKNCDSIKIIVMEGIEREAALKSALENTVEASVGCTSTVQSRSMGEYIEAIQSNEADIYIFGLESLTTDPLGFYDPFISGVADNWLNYSSDKLSAQYNSVRYVPLDERSFEQYLAVHNAIFSEAFVLPIGNPSPTFIFSSDVNVVKLNPFGFLFNRWFETGR